MASTITLVVSQSVLEKMYQHYANQINKVPNHTLFQAKTANCTITAYLSKKVVFQGANPALEANKWQAQTGTAPTSKIKSSKSNHLPANIASQSAIGCDEVGTGDYLGPLVVCCAYVTAEQTQMLLNLGIRDSKDLKDPDICYLAEKIKNIVPHQVLVLPNAKYNDMVDRGMNANAIKAYLHNQALLKLTRQLEELPSYLIMDEFVNERKYHEYLNEIPKQTTIVKENLYFVQKGESVHVAVAAASILARESFVKYMAIMSKQLDFNLPKGASSKVDGAGRQLVARYGMDKLKNISKWHFANTKKILK